MNNFAAYKKAWEKILIMDSNLIILVVVTAGVIFGIMGVLS